MSFVSVGYLWLLPVALGERDKCCDSFVRDIVDSGDHGACLFKPVDLPQLSRTYALICRSLIVDASSHRPSVNGIDHPIFREAPELVTPFLRVAVAILRVVVVNEMGILDVCVKRLVQGGVR